MSIVSRILVASILVSCAAGVCNAQQTVEQPPYDPQIHWAYSSFLGTGWYQISEQRDGFVMRVMPRWRLGEPEIDDGGKRQIEYTFRVPLTVGVSRLDFDDIGGTLDPGNLANASINFGLDANIPISDTFFIRPLAQVGYGTVLDGDESAVTYLAEFRARKEFSQKKFDWAIMGNLGYAGYTPNEGRDDDYTFVTLALEFSHPIGLRLSKTAQTLFHWHVSYTDLVDDIEFDFRRNETTPVGNYTQIGLSLGLRDEQVKLWALSFDRLGLAYNYSQQGEFRGIKLLFRSIYDF